jgi:sugar-specific transcriptional regulator TrmB
MDKITNFLKNLDLSDGETKIYLTLLKTEALSIRELASKTGIKRTTAYLYIDQLIEKGLIIKLVKGSHKLVSATEPKKNLSILTEEKLHTAKTMQSDLPDMLKIITDSLPSINDTNEAEIKYYKGKKGVKKIYEEALKAKELRSFANPSEIEKIFPENFKLFDDAFKQNPHINMYEILDNSPLSKEKSSGTKKNDRYFYKFLPEDMKLKSTDIRIYDGNICIINLKDTINGIVLHNTDLYLSFKLLFNFIWKMLPETKTGK